MEQKTIWSKKYDKWILIQDIHPKHPNLTKYGLKWWYDFKKDKLIHIDIVDSYIENTMGKRKTIRKESYLSKNMIQKIEDNHSNRRLNDIGRQILKDNGII